MKNKRQLFLLLLLIATNYVYSQHLPITTPTIETPENEFLAIFQKDKLANPIFLHGNIKEVSKKEIRHLTPNRKISLQENYRYTLNKQKQVITYASDVEFDEMKPAFLNVEKDVIIKGDTIINHNPFFYRFKNGQLIIRTEKRVKNIDKKTDSITFRYNKDNLVERKQYKKEIATKVTEISDGSFTEHDVISDYQLISYSTATYNHRNLLKWTQNVSMNQEILFVTKKSYQYNGFNKIVRATIISKNYNISSFKYLKDIRDWAKEEATIKPVKKEEITILYSYNTKNSITKIDFFTKNTQNKYVYALDYQKEKTIIKYTNKGKLEKVVEYVFDKKNNPIKELKYIFIDGKKYLDTSISMQITYY